jgi:vacuolar-type H+-ATPase subunit D/Vma8
VVAAVGVGALTLVPSSATSASASAAAAAAMARCRLPVSSAQKRHADAGAGAEVVPAVDAAVARLRAVLERMLELESLNEVIERLRGVIRVQEEIRSDTLERQKRRGREALESP